MCPVNFLDNPCTSIQNYNVFILSAHTSHSKCKYNVCIVPVERRSHGGILEFAGAGGGWYDAFFGKVFHEFIKIDIIRDPDPMPTITRSVHVLG